jgi:hypothetical protein
MTKCKMTRYIDITGKKYGRLLVIKPIKSDFYSKQWVCQCDCGNEKIASYHNLNNGHTKSCGCLQQESRLKGSDEPGFNFTINAYQRNAKARGYEFNLSREQFKDITNKNCFYCGCPPSNLSKGSKKYNKGDYIYSGIDRVDNDKGYTLDNVVPCCYPCNVRKRGLSKEDMIKILEFLGYEIIPPKLDDRV